MEEDFIFDEYHWSNCTVPDCSNKSCTGLSDTLCFPHYFKLPIRIVNGNPTPIFPDKATKDACYRLLRKALKELNQ